MEASKNISAAFVKAQKAFSPALKTSTNPHFKSRYADLAACVEAVIDALNDNGIAVIQRPILSESGVTIETMFIHESGETLSGGILNVPAQKQDAQGYGSAMTYCRRYGLMAACGIAPEDDDGNDASKKRPASQADGTNAAEADATSIAQLNAAKTVQDLVKTMNSLPQAEKAAATEHFNKRMSELKKAA